MVLKETMRYAHSDGHVDLCFDENGRTLITGGSDGDVRIYKGFEDEDPVSHQAGDFVYAVAQKGKWYYVAADDNAVQSYLIESGSPDGMIVRFTAHVTHLVVSQSGRLLVAGASDFVVKIIDLETKCHRTVTGHVAPVLSVSVHPMERFLASSSCDGTVRIVRLDDLREVKVITGLPKSNDFLTSKTLCRLTFDKKGKFLFVPFERSVKVFECENWVEKYELSDDSIQQTISIVSMSACGRYLAAACRDGKIVVWETAKRAVVLREWHDKRRAITSLAWNSQRYDLAYADNFGYIGLLKDVVVNQPLTSTTELDFQTASDLFDDDESAELSFDGAIPGVDGDDDDDADANAFVKATDRQTDASKGFADNTDSESVASLLKPPVASAAPAGSSWQPTPLQRPFQPGSCPVSVSTRFMVWNSIGIVTQYSTEEEESIDIEFHDSATHHAMHIGNALGHTMADLSAEAVLLATEADEDNPSQLVCMHFGSWDSCTEWNAIMPKGEDILAVCLGQGWLFVATDQRLVRIFTIGGLQKRIFRLPGPVVAMAAHMDNLFVVYHSGFGVAGDQCLSYRLLNLASKKNLCSDRLPLGAKATLAWIGFSDEGSVFAVDSNGVVQVLSLVFCDTWSVVANLRDHCKGKSDNYWVIGIRENPQQLRAILCKGAKYPPILPKPTVQILPFEIPVCELKSDKGLLEEHLLRAVVFGEHLSCWSADGCEVDESEKLKLQMFEEELLMKQFALSCKMKREFRAVEVCQMMSTSRAVQLAVKYATRIGLMQVAQRLNEIARQKADEERTDGVDAPTSLSNSCGRLPLRTTSERRIGGHSIVKHRDSEDDSYDELNDKMDKEEEEEPTKESKDASSTITVDRLLPLRCQSEDRRQIKSVSCSQSSTSLKNPFKMNKSSSVAKSASDRPKGTSLFDCLEKSKPGRVSFGFTSKPQQPQSDLSLIESKKQSSQVKISDLIKSKPSTAEKAKDTEGHNEEKLVSSSTGFHLWLEDSRSCLVSEFPDLDEDELTAKAETKFRFLTEEARKEWQMKAVAANDRKAKRVREEIDTEKLGDESFCSEPVAKKMSDVKERVQLKGTNKLSTYSFKKH